MRKLLITCDLCGAPIKGNPLVLAVDKIESGYLYPLSVEKPIDMCAKCVDEIRTKARSRAKNESVEEEEFEDDLPEIEEEPESIDEDEDLFDPEPEPKKTEEPSEEVKAFEKKLDNLEMLVNGTVSKAHRSKFDTGKMMALARAGWSPKQIADELGMTAKQVSSWFYNNKERVAEFNAKK